MLTVCCFTSQMTTFSRMEDSDSETCRNIRAGGLSNDESAEWEEALKAIYYSDEDVLLTPPVENEFWEETTRMDDKRHGWAYKVHFESGLVFQFLIFTSFLLFCNFQTYDINQSIQCYWQEFGNCFWRHGVTIQFQLEDDLRKLGVTPANFLFTVCNALNSLVHELIYV